MKTFFFGNYFYGLCAVALCVETCFTLHIGFPPVIFFLLIFCGTILFYTKAYIAQSINTFSNERTGWYLKNKKSVFNTQILFSVLIAVFSLLLLPNIFAAIKQQVWASFLLPISFFVVGIFYYGFSKKISLRNTHWLKPFVIGYVWAGLVTMLPFYYCALANNTSTQATIQCWQLFGYNWLFVAVLCIMFDIKDYATDYNHHLKTFVVSFGLRQTVFYIIIPLIIILFFAYFLWYRNLFIASILHLVLMLVGLDLLKKKSIWYYLLVIDGMMLVKAVSGIILAK